MKLKKLEKNKSFWSKLKANFTIIKKTPDGTKLKCGIKITKNF